MSGARRRMLATAALLLASCASSRAARNDDAPVPVRTIDLPPEVAGTDPHRPGGPLDLKPPPRFADAPDAGSYRELPGLFESPPPGSAGAQGAAGQMIWPH